MAIDTEDRRRSVLGSGLSFLTVFQNPDGTPSKEDRRHQSALYRGIDTVTVPRFRWIAEQDSAATFRCEQNAASTFKCEQDTNTTFGNEIDQDEG